VPVALWQLELLGGGVREDGYVVDFGKVKRVVRTLCKGLDERFLCPMQSPGLTIKVGWFLQQWREVTVSEC